MRQAAEVGNDDRVAQQAAEPVFLGHVAGQREAELRRAVATVEDVELEVSHAQDFVPAVAVDVDHLHGQVAGGQGCPQACGGLTELPEDLAVQVHRASGAKGIVVGVAGQETERLR